MKHAEMMTTQFKLNKLTQALRVAAVSAGLVWSAGAGAADMCPAGGGSGIISGTSFSPYNFGGVTLNKTLTLLNDVNNVRGAAFDPVKGEVVFVGDGTVPVNEKIDMDDLVVALYSVFVLNQDPGITFNTTDKAKAYATGLWDVSYFGAVRNHDFGQILFDADYLLKQLSLGIAPNGTLLTTQYPSLPSGYQSFAEREFKNNLTLVDNSGNALAIEFWFAPKAVTLDATDAGNDKKSFVFREVSMQVFPRILGPDGKTEAAPGSYDYRLLDQAQAFADHITNNYAAYAAIPGFEALKKLERLGKITALVRWMRDNNIPMDLSFLRDYVPKQVPATPSSVGILQVCKNAATGGIATTGNGPYTWNTICDLKINGGITYDLNNSYLTAAESAIVTAALSSGNRKLNPAVKADMTWAVDATTTAYAQTLAPTAKDGNMNFLETDLAFPNGAGQPLVFTRYYDTFSNARSGFGPGWSELPFELLFSEGRGNFCLSGTTSCLTSAYPQITVVDRLSGKMVVFNLSGQVSWTNQSGQTVFKPDYHADKTNDYLYEYPAGGYFIYEQHDANGRVTKQAWFQEMGTPTNPKFNAVPVTLGTETANWVEFGYDTNGRLQTITGQNGQVIQVGFNGDRISRVWYSSANGTREATYSYDNGRLGTVNRASHSLSYAYKDPADATSGTLASVTDTLRGQTVVNLSGVDLENRVYEALPEGNAALKQNVAYDRVAGITTASDQMGRVSVTKRDPKQRLTEVSRTATLASGANATLTSKMIYNDVTNNALAGPERVVDIHNNPVTYTYDAAGRVTSIKDVLNRTTTIEYGVDAVDNLAVIVTTDPKSHASIKKYDDQGRVVASYRIATVSSRVTDATTGIVKFSFSYPSGYKQSVKYDATTGAVTEVNNDAAGLQSKYSWITANESVKVLTRDAFGQAKSVQSAAGFKTAYDYDGLARMKSMQGPADVAPVQLAYYEGGYQQDAVSQIVTPVGTISKDYDVVNRQSSTKDARGVVTTSFYNRKNQLERVVETAPNSGQGTGSTVLTTRYFYDDFGKLSYKLMPNGSQANYKYDGFDRLVKMEELDAGNVTVNPVAPTVTSQPAPTVNWNPANPPVLDIDASTTVPNGSVSYVLVSGPAGMTINKVTGVITWTPTTSQTSDTAYKVVVQVVGSDGGVKDVTFDIKVSVNGSSVDSDGDSIPDITDNCTNVANVDQRDTDGDGIGNACDADLNNDGVVNFADLAIMKSWYGSSDPDADLDGNGTVGVGDLDKLKAQFGSAPGPSAVAK